MPHYTYTDGHAGEQAMHYAPRLKREMHTVEVGLAIGRGSFGKPFPVKSGVVIFECNAKDIEEADALFAQATGRNIIKEAWVLCRIGS